MKSVLVDDRQRVGPIERTGAPVAGAKLVALTGDAIDKLIKENSYYAKATIPGGMYAGNPNPTQTYGVLATLVTSAKVPEKAVYTLVKAVYQHVKAQQVSEQPAEYIDPRFAGDAAS